MKGQYFSFDAIIGASIFILTLIAILSYWYGVSNSIEQQQTVFSREAIRIADLLYSPSDVPYGITMNWSDRHINSTKIMEDFCGQSTAKETLGSEYAVAIHFTNREGDLFGPPCWWTSDVAEAQASDYIYATDVYRLRRVGSYLTESGETELGYVDIYVYNPYEAK